MAETTSDSRNSVIAVNVSAAPKKSWIASQPCSVRIGGVPPPTQSLSHTELPPCSGWYNPQWMRSGERASHISGRQNGFAVVGRVEYLGNKQAGGRHTLGCKSVAFTCNDPVNWVKNAIDYDHGLETIAVTAGDICPQPRTGFSRS